jgi:hypothetical protein
VFCIGADLGQSVDYTAIGIIENTDTLDLRHIERVPLGESYTGVVDHLAALKASLPDSRLVIDNTGVGRPVRDMLTERGVDVAADSITSVKKTRYVDGSWRVPKRELIRGVVVEMENGGLRVAAGLPYTDALKSELKDFQATFTEKGSAVFGGKREHDDLVIAVALAVWGLTSGETL